MTTPRKITSFEEWCAIQPGSIMEISEYHNGFIDPNDREFFLTLSSAKKGKSFEEKTVIEAWNITQNTTYNISFGKDVWTWVILSEPHDEDT